MSVPNLRHPLGLEHAEWQELLHSLGERAFRARQVLRWIHQRGVWDAAQMTDLSQALRARLQAMGLQAAPLVVQRLQRSQDGTRKLLLGLSDRGQVECVLFPMGSSSEPQRRATLCISTQYGCAMGCVFCASGQLGLQRGLKAEEILAQVLLARHYLEPQEDLRNLVFMGMGEPLHHYDETARALRLLTHPDGGQMSPRRITVSSVGLIPGIQRLGEDFRGQVGLAISLHAPDDETRSRILPLNRRYPLQQLLQALQAYPLPPRRRITIEYTLIAGLNDSLSQARALVKLLRPVRVKVNLIPMNPIAGSELQAPTASTVDHFRRVLTDAGLSCFVRLRRGSDVAAACGQLALAPSLVQLKQRPA